MFPRHSLYLLMRESEPKSIMGGNLFCRSGRGRFPLPEQRPPERKENAPTSDEARRVVARPEVFRRDPPASILKPHAFRFPHSAIPCAASPLLRANGSGRGRYRFGRGERYPACSSCCLSILSTYQCANRSRNRSWPANFFCGRRASTSISWPPPLRRYAPSSDQFTDAPGSPHCC
jgi:hypothetical protein